MTLRHSLVATIVASATPAILVAQSIRGTVVDSLSGRPVPNARVSVSGTPLRAVTDSLGRFAFSNVPRGEHGLTIHTPSLDSLSAAYTTPVTVSGETITLAVRIPTALQIAATACGERGYGNGGIVLGRLKVAGDSTASLSGTVSAEWKASGAGDSSRWVSARSDAAGRFALCGVPLDTALNVRAMTDAASGLSSSVRVSSSARFGRAEVVLRREVTTTATFAGLVTDSANKPIVGVEVTLPDLGRGAATNEQGAFIVRDVPAGAQRVIVRHLGYALVETQLTFANGRTVQRHITMTRIAALDSIVVTEKAVDHQLADFEDNRRLGLGHFLTRAELAPLEGVSTGAVLNTVPGIKVSAFGSYAWVGSGRHGLTSITDAANVGLDPSDMVKHAPLWDCYALVYLDDHLVWRGLKFPSQGRVRQGLTWEPLFDVNSIPVSEIEAIEYFASAAELPLKYAVLNSQCGVLVIHTIRYHATDATTASGKPPVP